MRTRFLRNNTTSTGRVGILVAGRRLERNWKVDLLVNGSAVGPLSEISKNTEVVSREVVVEKARGVEAEKRSGRRI